MKWGWAGTRELKLHVLLRAANLRHQHFIFSFFAHAMSHAISVIRAQELCESRGGRPGLSVLTSLMVSVDVKLY